MHDLIVLDGRTGKFVVVGLDVPRMTAAVRSMVGEEFLLRNVPWNSISDLGEGQDSVQIMGRSCEKQVAVASKRHAVGDLCCFAATHRPTNLPRMCA
jgi:hypothetical protein